MKAKEGVRFVTATELATLYVDRAIDRPYGTKELLEIARIAQNEITFARFGGYTLSAADMFGLLTQAVASLSERGTLPTTTQLTILDGPARVFARSTGPHSGRHRWEAFVRAVRDTAGYCRTHRRVPDEVWVGAENVSPADYLATLAGVVEEIIVTGQAPPVVEWKTGRFTSDRYVAEDSTKLWGWIIFPEGFHAPRIMELARLQAWTLKPALLER